MRSSSRALVLVLVLAACSGGDGGRAFALDGSPRVPDDEGVVTAVDLESVTIDGDRTYEVDRDLAAFSAIDLSTVPLLYTRGQYVQVGVDGDELVWIGAVAKPFATEPPFVLYTGEVEAVTATTIEFTNGTVLRAARGVLVDDLVGAKVRVSIDPEARAVTEVLR